MPRIGGILTSHDLICGERRNSFSKSGCFLLAHKKQCNSALSDCHHSCQLIPPSKSTIRWIFDTLMKDRKEEKWGKTKIGVGSFVISKVGDMENTREGETIRTRKYTKVLSQNDVTVTNNKGGHYLLCNLPENLFLCCCRFFARA